MFVVLSQKRPKFGHLEFKPGDVRGDHPIALSLKNLFLEAEDCCMCAKNTCCFEKLSSLLFVCSALRTCCSNCDFMGHPLLLLQARHITILPSVVKEPYVFTRKFNYDAREDAAGAIMISTLQT
jgi:hypothetical protein